MKGNGDFGYYSDMYTSSSTTYNTGGFSDPNIDSHESRKMPAANTEAFNEILIVGSSGSYWHGSNFQSQHQQYSSLTGTQYATRARFSCTDPCCRPQFALTLVVRLQNLSCHPHRHVELWLLHFRRHCQLDEYEWSCL